MSTQGLLSASYHTIEIALYEIDLVESPICLPRVPTTVVNRTGRLEFIYASLLATRKIFDVYSSVPIERLPSICLTLWVQFNHALLNGVKLLASEADGWDVQHARRLLNFHNILHCQVKAMEETISKRGCGSNTPMDGKDVFIRFLAKVHHVLRWYESSQIPRTETQGPSDPPTESSGSMEVSDPEEPPLVFDDGFWLNLFDDNWMLAGDGLGT